MSKLNEEGKQLANAK